MGIGTLLCIFDWEDDAVEKRPWPKRCLADPPCIIAWLDLGVPPILFVLRWRFNKFIIFSPSLLL